MPKPTFRDRFTLIGQDEHESRPAGDATVPNDTSVSTYYDTADSGSTGGGTYASGTRTVGFGENITSAVKNRSSWALAHSTDDLYEHSGTRLDTQTQVAGGGGDAEIQVAFAAGPPIQSAVVYLGPQGTAAVTAQGYISVYDDTYGDVVEATGDKVIVGDVQVDIPAVLGGGRQTCYPGAGLPALSTGTLPKITAVGTATVYDIDIDANLVGAAAGVSIFNYSHWIRQSQAYRAGGAYSLLEESFATIVDFTDLQNFQVHRDVTVAGLDWQVDDEIAISHFVYSPWTLYFGFIGAGAVVVPAGVTYTVLYSTYSTHGFVTEDAVARLLNIASEKLPYELVLTFQGGLDGEYDRIGYIGAADGSGRTITVDSGPVEVDIDRAGEIGFQASITSGNGGNFGVYSYNETAAMHDRCTGAVSATALTVNDAAGTIWSQGDTCTGSAVGVLTITAGLHQFANGAANDSNIFPGLDLVLLLDGLGDPVTQTGSQNGLYLISHIIGNTTLQVVTLDYSDITPDITQTATATLIRPVAVDMTGRIGFNPGGTGVQHHTNIFTSRGTGVDASGASLYSAVELNALYNFAAGATSAFCQHMIGNINRQYPLMSDRFAASSYATHYVPTRYLGCVGDVLTDIDVIIEALDKTDADDLIFGWTWTEFSPGVGEAEFRWDADKATVTAPVSVIGNYPFGHASGLDMDSAGTHLADPASYTLGARGTNDHVELIANYHDAGATKLRGGLQAYFEGGGVKDSWALLRETPVGAAGVPVVPQTPIKTTTDANIEHRFEIEHDTNIGWSDWRTLYKVVPLGIGECFDAAAAAWFSFTLGGTLVWENGADAANDWVYFPLLVPHGSLITKGFCRYYASAALGGAAGALDVIRVDNSAATGAAGAGAVVQNLRGAGAVAINPGAGNTVDYTYNCDQNQTVDLETYSYYIRITAGVNGGGSMQRIMQIKVEFQWVDIFPE